MLDYLDQLNRFTMLDKIRLPDFPSIVQQLNDMKIGPSWGVIDRQKFVEVSSKAIYWAVAYLIGEHLCCLLYVLNVVKT